MQNNRPKKDDLFEQMFKQASEPYTVMRPLTAIHLKPPGVRTTEGRTTRITTGDLVLIENGLLVDLTGEPSHKIMLLHGTSADTVFSITVENLADKNLSVINI